MDGRRASPNVSENLAAVQAQLSRTALPLSVATRMPPTQAEIEVALQKFITRHFPVARQHRVGLHDSLVGLGIVDSLGVLEIVTFIDKELGVALSDDDVSTETFESIVTISELVCRHLAPEAAP